MFSSGLSAKLYYSNVLLYRGELIRRKIMSKGKFILPLEKEGFGQPNNKTCWYACYAMMYVWKNMSVAQLDSNLVKAGYNLSEIKNRGLEDYEYQKVARAVGTKEVLTISAVNWSLDDVADRLKRWGPIFLATKELGGGHAMVLYGVDLALEKLIVADPYTVGGDYKSAHDEYFTIKTFRQTVQPVGYAVQCF